MSPVSQPDRKQQKRSEKKRPDNLSVTAIGRLQFLVGSRSRDAECHVVDLEEKACSCEKFMIRHEVCHHATAVIAYCRKLLDEMEKEHAKK